MSNPSLSLPSNHPITPTDSARNLSFIFDSSLTFSKQISSLSSACNYHIHDLRHIRHTLDLKTASVIATSLVHSKLDYCNSLYLNLSKNKISRLQLLTHHKEMIEEHKPQRSLRSSSQLLLQEPTYRTVTSRRFFRYVAAKTWNSLPEAIRTIDTLEPCRRHVKTFLFRQSYCN